VFLEKLIGLQLVKKFREFYGTRRFINAFTSARQLYLSWASSIQSKPHIPIPENPSLYEGESNIFQTGATIYTAVVVLFILGGKGVGWLLVIILQF
jgi:hypothetical protein